MKAFADDIATVVTDCKCGQVILPKIFEDFERMSGVDLNFKKTICIPLWGNGEVDIRSHLNDGFWKDLTVSSHGT